MRQLITEVVFCMTHQFDREKPAYTVTTLAFVAHIVAIDDAVAPATSDTFQNVAVTAYETSFFAFCMYNNYITIWPLYSDVVYTAK